MTPPGGRECGESEPEFAGVILREVQPSEGSMLVL
jgi:hypothetical protein